MKEIWRSDWVGSDLFDQFGFGKPLDQAMGEEMLMTGLERYHSVSVRNVARHMRVVLDSVETSSMKLLVAPADIDRPNGPPILAERSAAG